MMILATLKGSTPKKKEKLNLFKRMHCYGIFGALHCRWTDLFIGTTFPHAYTFLCTRTAMPAPHCVTRLSDGRVKNQKCHNIAYT